MVPSSLMRECNCRAKGIIIPWLEEYGILPQYFLWNYIQADPIEHHREEVPLGHPLSAQWSFRFYLPWAADENLYAMPISVGVRACTPGLPVLDSSQHGQHWEVVESIAGISKEEDFEDIPPWNYPLITLSIQCSRVTSPACEPSPNSLTPWGGTTVSSTGVLGRVCACRHLSPLPICLLLHKYLFLLLYSIPGALLFSFIRVP